MKSRNTINRQKARNRAQETVMVRVQETVMVRAQETVMVKI